MTGIEWTDQTWNPVVGCSRVSPGCANCYAAAMDKRIRGKDGEEWRDWSAPNAEYNVRLHPERLTAPLHWKKPRRVFVNSMSDLFHERVPNEFIDRVFAVMASAPQHQFQVLTKRPERMRKYLSDPERTEAIGFQAMTDYEEGLAVARAQSLIHWRPDGRGVSDKGATAQFHGDMCAWPLPNVWLGVSVEDQRRADERVPLLLETPAAVRFLSCEPLLGEVNLYQATCTDAKGRNTYTEDDQQRPVEQFALGLDWVIVGGESGPGARPCDLAWVRGIVGQCRAASLPVFVKQLGARPLFPCSCGRTGSEAEQHAFCEEPSRQLRDRKGGDPSEWPEDLRVREFPA